MKMLLDDMNQISVNTFNCCASVYEQRFKDISLYKTRIDEFCSYLIFDKYKILDLGCGPGNYCYYISKVKGFYNIIGVDRSDEMIKIAKKNFPGGVFNVADIRKLNYTSESFHGIIASFCIPYLSYNDTADFIRNITKILKPSGVVYISCFEGTHSGFEQTNFSGEMALYVYYYSEEFLINILEDNGLQVLSFNRQDNTESAENFSTNMIIIAQKAT
jgi:ubiquinone/menaquinone biosynthesis C-methylase UbiE